MRAVWHSPYASSPRNWSFREIKRDLQALVVNQMRLEEPFQDSLSVDKPVQWTVGGSTTRIGCLRLKIQPRFVLHPIQNPAKRKFLQEVHWFQWHVKIRRLSELLQDTRALALSCLFPNDYNYTVNCSDMRESTNINSGYGASIYFLLSSFWEAYIHQKPFQTIQKWSWLYANTDVGINSWIDCTVQDQSCLYLPISPCPREDTDLPKLKAHPDKANATQMMRWQWMAEYLARPNQLMRQAMQRIRQPACSSCRCWYACTSVSKICSRQGIFRYYSNP